MKKINIILLCVIIALSFFGCAKGGETAQQPTSVSFAGAVSTTESTQVKTTAKAKTTEKDESALPDKTTFLQKKTTAAEKSSKADSPKTTLKKTTAKPETTKKHSAVNTTKKPGETTAAPTEKETVTCSISIECKALLDNIDDLKPGHEAFVPPNGVILSPTSLTVKKGASVYDVVKTVCAQNAIKLTEQNSLYSKYIVGFNNIDEKDCGKESGWKYFVNGKSPSKSVDRYILNDGDAVEFSFVTKA